MNALVGFQLLDDGTPASLGLICASAVALFIGTGYISLDTAFNWTGKFESSTGVNDQNRNIALYVLYQLFPLICLVLFYAFEAVLVLRVLGEFRPMRTSIYNLQSKEYLFPGDFFFLSPFLGSLLTISQSTSQVPPSFSLLVKFSNM